MTAWGAHLHAGCAPFGADPMTSSLPALSFCVIDGTALFLDLAGDRYFRLPEPANASFVASLVNGVAFAPAFAAVGLERFSTLAPLAAQPVKCTPQDCADVSTFLPPLTLICRALWEQFAAERRLKRRGLYAVLSDLQKALRQCPREARPMDARCAAVVKAFDQTAFVRSAVDRCLPRSLALAKLLARYGCRCQVVVGVKLHPFAAHCWVQSDHLVLSESVEEAARYTPILIL